MTAPAQPDPADRWPELLAAYADGELDAEARARVEQWLAEHPEAREQLQAQRELSPENWQLWQNAEPPAPSEEAWAAIRRSVEDETGAPRVPPAVRWDRAAVWVVGAMAAAAAVLVAWWATLGPDPPRPRPEPGRPQPEVAGPGRPGPDAEVAALPIASDDDVELLRVPGGELAWLVVGAHPVPDALVLAGPDDVEVTDIDPDDWPEGGPKMVTAPGDAPMIFAKAR
jgi:hypothetical protein